MDDALEPPFPPEIWELIFRHCTVPELKQVRLVSRWWNAIVLGSPVLWCRFCVRFWQLPETPSLAMLPPVRRVAFQCDIDSISSWWPNFGERLEELTINGGDLSITTLFEMLKLCPNLKHLYLSQVCLKNGQVDDDFSLDFLKKLEIDEVYLSDIDLPYYLEAIIPCLKHCSLHYVDERDPDQFEINCWIRFIRHVQDTLHTLKLPREFVLVDELCQMNRLHLKQVDLTIGSSSQPWNAKIWTTFCRMQQSLQNLSIMGDNITNEVLLFTIQNLPNLKQIDSNMNCTSLTVPTFLNGPCSVQRAEIFGYPAALQFCNPLSPTLTKLSLGGVTIVDGVEYLLNSPNITKLDLWRCDLSGCRVPKGNPSVLQHLVLGRCTTSQEMLEYILSNHPRLETMEFYHMEYIDKGTIIKLLCVSPKLSYFRIRGCFRLAVTSGEEIMQKYYNVQNWEESSRKVRFDL